MLHATKYRICTVLLVLSLSTSFFSFHLPKGTFYLDEMVIASAAHDTAKNAEGDLLRSLSYYIDGAWLYCGETGGKSNTSTFASLKVTYGLHGRTQKLIHFEAATQTDRCANDSPSEHLRFVPTVLLPITCRDHDVHCNTEHSTNATVSLPARLEFQHFASEEAVKCLRNQRILMIGDSHMRNLWRALMDVLTDNFEHDYHRWDGYQDWQDFPTNITWDQVDQFLPNAMYARMNDHSKIGVTGACTFISKEERNPNATGLGRYWNCMSAKGVNEVRKKFDLRRLENNVTSTNNITIDASWCASSFQVGLEGNAAVRGGECRDTRGFFARDKGDSTSYLERLLSETTYDAVILGHHVHDIKREHCLKAGIDPLNCRKELGIDLIRNTERFASWAKENKINLVWVTTGPMVLDNIPEQYRASQLPEDMDYEMETMASIMKSKGFPVFDAYHIAAACHRKEREVRSKGGDFPPCFSDGMHASRFLDRSKAQILLNWKCQ